MLSLFTLEIEHGITAWTWSMLPLDQVSLHVDGWINLLMLLHSAKEIEQTC